jgi:DNA-binding transcriptional LysR family regulator
MNPRKLSTDLLVAFNSLVKERSVSRAAERMSLSQPAMSRALARLRDIFRDDLLVRRGAQMYLTPQAEKLAPTVGKILASIEMLAADEPFVPQFHEGILRVAATDYGSMVILPLFLDQMTAQAPKLRIEVSGWDAQTVVNLKNGCIDIALGAAPDDLAGLETQHLFDETLIGVARRNHPIFEDGISIRSYIRYPHVVVSTGGGKRVGVDLALEKLKKKRNVALRMPHFLSAGFIVGNSNLLLTTPQRIARIIADSAPVKFFKPPLPAQRFSYYQIWCAYRNEERMLQWVRGLIWGATAKLRK